MATQNSPEDYQKVKTILAAALEIPLPERAGFLQSACQGNEKLLAEVESLLAVSDEGRIFLEEISAPDILLDLFDNKKSITGQKIDDYLLEREIGRGGMGVVFLASRVDFPQRVAVKLIKRGMDSDAILERFARERKILAALNHPFIARLTDGGTTDEDLPFFVMEYVEGEPVDEYCQKNNLSQKEILELFRKICSAVAFAHQKLVVHRDLKPSNILITEDGTPKLLDFGIAKLLNPEEDYKETETGQRALTPAYASPEQIRGEQVDTRSDVYSLGKILTELLLYSTGKSGSAEKDSDIRDASENNLRQKLAADLQAILQTALREETTRRYDSVEKFSDDIRRYQNGLPVSARRDTFTYRTRKFIRRNYISVLAASFLLLLAMTGLTFIIREHNRAERRYNDVRRLSNSFLFEFDDAIKNLPGSIPARKLVVERALEYLDRLDQEADNDASLQRELGAAYEKVGQIQGNSYYPNIGDTDASQKSYQRSLAIRERLAAAEPGNLELQKELSDSFEGIGDVFITVDDLQNGLDNYQKSLAIREKIAASSPDNQPNQAALGTIYSKIGDVEGLDGLPNLGNTEGALENYQKAVAIDEKLINSVPDNFNYRMNYAQRLSNLGLLYRVAGNTSGAVESCRKADVIYQALNEIDPNNFDARFNLLANNATLRYALVDDQQYDEAVSLMNQTIEMLEDMQAADSTNTLVRRSLGVSYNALSRTLVRKGDFDRAGENSRKALKITEELAGKDLANAEYTSDLAATLQFLGDVELYQKNYNAAQADYLSAIKIYRKNLEANPTNARTKDNLLNCLEGIGKTDAAKGDFTGAEKAFTELIPAAEDISQKSPVNVLLQSRLALRYMELGEIYLEEGRSSNAPKNEDNNRKAEIYFQKSFQIWDKMRRLNILNKSDAVYYQNVIARLKS